MALRDILVYVDKTKDSVARLKLSVDLASRHDSRLTALYVREWSEEQQQQHRTAEMARVSGEELDRLNRRAEAFNDRESDELRSTLETLSRENALTTEWRIVAGPASSTVPQHARYADLCILGHYRSMRQDPNSYSFSEKLLFSSGRPSLFIPPDRTLTVLGRHVAVAWNSSRAAARAVNDALPLIERAERVTILTVNPEDFIVRNGALPPERMVEHLERHGVRPELVKLEDVPTELIADTLQSKARELGADLMVAGAFGTPRLWERLLGGTTRDLLDSMRLPTLMSN
jgi:nucleotide-binding universal stress UspA family protein